MAPAPFMGPEGFCEGGRGGRTLRERSQVVARIVQLDSGLSMGKTPKPWPPVAKMWSSAGIFASLRARK